MRPLIVSIAVALAAAAAFGASPATAAPAAKKTLHVAISAQSHHPKLGHTWTYWVRVTDAATGKPVACLIHLQFTFGGAPVGEVGRHHVKNGFWKETIPAHGPNAFPQAAVGQHVVLRATVTAPGYRTATAGWAVTAVT